MVFDMIMDFIYDNFIVFYIVFIVCYGLYALVLLKRIRKSKIKKSYKILQQAFKEETILAKNDVRLIYKCSKIPMSFVDYLDGFIFYLRDTMQGNKEIFNKINTVIGTMASEERQEKPFEDIEQYEQQLLKAIDEAVQKGEKQSVHNELGFLATSIKNSQRKIKRLTRVNAWSIPVSVISILITIVIWRLGRTSISERDIETIKENTRTVVIETLDLKQSTQSQEPLILQ